MRPGFFEGVGALRGIAALLVVVQHAGYFATAATGTPYTDLMKIDFGLIGVSMFFVISGFVIGLNRDLPTREFALRRALRIYPPFWAAYALSALLVFSLGQEIGIAWHAVLLLPSRGYPSIPIPIWTLVFEVFFYALAAGVFALRLSDRALSALALVWIIVVQTMAPYMAGSIATLPGGFILISPNNVFFAVGLICALHRDAFARVGSNGALAVAALAGLVLTVMPALPHVGALCVLAVGLAAIMLAATCIERWPVLLVRLGDASYGLFLLHYAAMVAALSWLATYQLSAWALAGTLIAVGLAFGVPFGLAEYALHRTLLRAFKRVST